jgi:hypothetical protein
MNEKQIIEKVKKYMGSFWIIDMERVCLKAIKLCSEAQIVKCSRCGKPLDIFECHICIANRIKSIVESKEKEIEDLKERLDNFIKYSDFLERKLEAMTEKIDKTIESLEKPDTELMLTYENVVEILKSLKGGGD